MEETIFGDTTKARFGISGMHSFLHLYTAGPPIVKLWNANNLKDVATNTFPLFREG